MTRSSLILRFKNLLNDLQDRFSIINNLVTDKIYIFNNEINHLKSRLSLDYIAEIISKLYDQKENLDRILSISIENKLSGLHQKISDYKKSLDSNNIKNILEKGFGLIKDENDKIVNKSKMLSIGQKISINLIDGKVEAEIIEK